MRDNSPSFLFESYCIIGDIIWMSARDFNGLLKGNLKNGEIEFIGCFPGEHPLQKRLHYGEAIYREEKIYFIPLESNYLHVYNLRTCSLEKHEIEKKPGGGYAKAVQMYDELYLISTRTTEILKYNLRSNISEIVYRPRTIENYGYAHGIYVSGYDVFLMLSQKNVMRRINLLDYQAEDYQIGEEQRQYQIVAGTDQRIYFVNKEEPEIYCWDIALKREENRSDIEYGIKLNSWQWGKLVLGNAPLGDGITLLDIEQMTASKVYLNEKSTQPKRNVFEIQNAFIYNQDLCFVWEGDEAIYSLAKEEKIAQFILTDEVFQSIHSEIEQNMGSYQKTVFDEVDVFQISDFIRYMYTWQQREKQDENLKKREVGEAVFRRVYDIK